MSTLGEARFQGIKVRTSSISAEVSLVPVGSWILNDKNLIRQMSEWRGRSMRAFHIQFDSTPGKTEGYLKDFSLGQDNRLLFMIEVSGNFAGHIGLAGITEDTAEVDNVMRGFTNTYPGLMEASGCALADWSFSQLGLDTLFLRVLSDNHKAKALYERLGFVTTERNPLRLEEGVESFALVRCSEREATVTFTSNVMTLDRRVFEARMSDRRS